MLIVCTLLNKLIKPFPVKPDKKQNNIYILIKQNVYSMKEKDDPITQKNETASNR